MQEAADGTIFLPEDEPLVIDMMIQYFYLLDYQQSLYSDSTSQSPELEQTNSTHISCLLLHAKVYAVAEKYAIGGLKALAVAKFKTAATQAWDPTAFLDAASETYTSTIDTDRGLRDAVIEVFAAHKDLLYDGKAKVVVERLGPLGYDFLAAPKTGVTSEGQVDMLDDIRTPQEFARQSTTIRSATCDTQLAPETYTHEDITANPDNRSQVTDYICPRSHVTHQPVVGDQANHAIVAPHQYGKGRSTIRNDFDCSRSLARKLHVRHELSDAWHGDLLSDRRIP
ncbi:BTB/POZ domain-containing protein [Colletotrichum salicis]|uniref:BTB/POZ domain-containing protein n=1 Tax=Colletotrichum salicis TaxID=1209931 RepID=A0A135V6P5_9PEZI|nr:BTB/POZ domain-containing protein [Colletotrichum salicis]